MRLLSLALCIVGGCFLAGCSGSRKSAKAPPADLSVSLGKGGGFTGLWQGYSVFADGRVESWRGQVAAYSGEPSGQLPAATVDSIWAAVRGADLLARTDDQRGNITGHIRVVANSDTTSVWWPGGALTEHPSHDLELLYAHILDQIGPHLDG